MPRPLREPLYRLFARYVGANIEEAELPLEEYATFGAFFARRLRVGARSISAAEDVAIIAPCDGVVAASGTATAGRMIQAKGIGYDLADLVADAALARAFTGGDYLTVYLSPRDYHRVHAPLSGVFEGYDYIPGRQLPVNELFTRSVPGLWATNERLVLRLRTDAGQVAVIMVGALAVGNISITHEAMETRHLRPFKARRSVRLDDPVPLARGAELAAFELGSTVILLFEPERARIADVSVGDPIRLGQPVGTIRVAPTESLPRRGRPGRLPRINCDER